MWNMVRKCITTWEFSLWCVKPTNLYLDNMVDYAFALSFSDSCPWDVKRVETIARILSKLLTVYDTIYLLSIFLLSYLRRYIYLFLLPNTYLVNGKKKIWAKNKLWATCLLLRYNVPDIYTVSETSRSCFRKQCFSANHRKWGWLKKCTYKKIFVFLKQTFYRWPLNVPATEIVTCILMNECGMAFIYLSEKDQIDQP